NIERSVADCRVRCQIITRHRVDPAPRRQHRQIQPVPAVNRELRELPWIDVGRLARLSRIDEGGCRAYSDRFLHARWGNLEIHHGLLPYQQLQSTSSNGRKPLQL